jgi:uncharacterized protein YbjT (DUF2867 family)
MATRSVATVFGGSGFIGRYVVQRLAQKGYIVRVAVRDPIRAGFLKVTGVVGQIVPLYASVTNEATVARAVTGAELVVNLVGILAERRGADFHAIHAEAAGRAARLAAAAGVFRFVHVSAIGADPASPSRYGSSKAAGEQAVRQHFPGATILRPSVVFGPEDQFFNRFGTMAMLSPIMPVFSGKTRLQPVYVGDVADAVIAALARAEAAGAIYELGGPRVMSLREVLRFVLEQTGRRRMMVPVPKALAALMGSVMEWLPTKPLTRDQLRMLARDNVVAAGMPGLRELGITPTPIEMVVPGYLRRFRPGGGREVVRNREAKGDKSDLSYPISDAA